ncbi:putative 3-hydroxybutyryl-CoA dehydrogenase [subsurface metagenome]
MGHGIAQAFAQGGYQVSLFSRSQKTLDRAFTLIKTSLDTLAEGELLERGQIPAILSRITPTQSLEEGARDADIALETVVEDAEAKKEVFAQLDAYCPPRALLASNTTFLNIFDIVKTSRPDKVLLCHWYTPPQIIPLVDVVKGPQTDEANVELVVGILKEIGKRPVIMRKFIPGYIISRIQLALQREVYFLLDNDYVTPEQLDEAAKFGLALRMLIVGVVQRFDFGGLDLSVKNLKNPKIQPTPLDYQPKKIFELVNEGYLGVKTGRGFYDYQGRSEEELCHERDIKLIRILKACESLADRTE